MRPVLGPGLKISDQVPSSFKTNLRLTAYPGAVIILKKGAARGGCAAPGRRQHPNRCQSLTARRPNVMEGDVHAVLVGFC